MELDVIALWHVTKPLVIPLRRLQFLANEKGDPKAARF